MARMQSVAVKNEQICGLNGTLFYFYISQRKFMPEQYLI